MIMALIPARTGSRGIPNKNFRLMPNGLSPTQMAIHVADLAGVKHIIVSSDGAFWPDRVKDNGHTLTYLHAPAPLHTDDCPMIDVVQDALARVPGEPDDIWVLLQPTQPLREPKHITAAITLLQESQADSVVSVVELPRTHSPDLVCQIVVFPHRVEQLRPWPYVSDEGESMRSWSDRPTRRQDAQPAFAPDGTVYAFRRKTVEAYGNIYGEWARPLIIPASETQALDTPLDWQEAERRLRERETNTALTACR